MRKHFLFLALSISISAKAQNSFQILSIGDLRTTGRNLINGCKIGYRTMGILNAERTNAVLIPTWFTGTSEALTTVIPSIMDTSGLYIIMVDALGNGVSSSPSNTREFPEITITDMVNAEHQLLTQHLKIQHLKAVIGISMGGMQTFEWMVKYPGFMDYAIPIVGTPKQSFYDLMLWRTMANIIEQARNGKIDENLAMQLFMDIGTLNGNTPEYYATSYSPDSIDAFISNLHKRKFNMENYLSQLKAMISHDIFKSSGLTETEISKVIKAKLMVVVSKQDMVVNPSNAASFAMRNNYRLVELKSNRGHMATEYEADIIKAAILEFMK